MPRRTFVLSAALVLALAVPAAAGAAPAITTPLDPCYVTAGPTERQAVTVAATGFSPNAQVDIALDGTVEGAAFQTDASGTLPAVVDTIGAPFVESGIRPFTLTVTERGNPANVASATSKTSALDVSVTPRRARPSRRVRFAGTGFIEDKAVYAHYRFAGRLRRTVRMVRRTGECGTWTARRRQIPVSDPGTGRWKVRFDQRRRFRRVPTSIFVELPITVTRVPV